MQDFVRACRREEKGKKESSTKKVRNATSETRLDAEDAGDRSVNMIGDVQWPREGIYESVSNWGILGTALVWDKSEDIVGLRTM